MTDTSRRRFIATVTIAAGGVAAAPQVWAQSKPKLPVDAPIAVALGYQEDVSLVDTAKYPKRAGAEGAKQFCNNCALYKEVADGYGDCTAIPTNLVAGAGWCNAWVPAS